MNIKGAAAGGCSAVPGARLRVGFRGCFEIHCKTIIWKARVRFEDFFPHLAHSVVLDIRQ